MAIKPVAEKPVVKPISDSNKPATPTIQPINKTPVIKKNLSAGAVKKPIKATTPVGQVQPIKRKIGKIQNPGNPIPTPRPVREKASTDPWKTGW